MAICGDRRREFSCFESVACKHFLKLFATIM
jgi:hypothetical protein